MAQANSNTLSMQSPERVAETYGGNKQKIAQAVQMGVIDPTTGLMAGMFIDRMRSAQAQEQAPNQTVAQRVLGPQAPPAGLGATPQGMQMGGGPGPQMAAPPQMIPPAPQGPVRMAEGGLTTLPIPDDMYDEQSFSGGGIVAFARGDQVDARAERLKVLMATMGNPNYLQNSTSAERRALSAEIDQLRIGKPYVAPDLPPATENTNLLAGMFSAATDTGATNEQRNEARRAIYANAESQKQPEVITPAPSNYKSDLGRVNMGGYDPNRSSPEAQLNAILGRSPTPKEGPPPAPLGDRGVGGAPRAPRSSTETTGGVPDYLKGLQATAVPGLGATQKEMLDLIGGVPAPKGTSAEDKAARKNEDLFSTLAQIGFGMAAGESPNALTNIGKAAAAAVPGMQEAIKERRKDTKEELQQQYAYELAKHGLSKDALVAAVGRTDTLTKNELAKVTALAEIKSKQIEGDKDRAVQRSGQDNTSKYYDHLRGAKAAEIERIADIISKGKGISIEQARVEAVNILNPSYTRGTKLTPYQAGLAARAEYKIAFPMDPPPEGAEAWIKNKTAEILAGDGDDETPPPANRQLFDEQGNPR